MDNEIVHKERLPAQPPVAQWPSSLFLNRHDNSALLEGTALESTALESPSLNTKAVAEQIVTENPLLGERIAKSCKLSMDDSCGMLVNLIRFLELIAISPVSLTPSHKIDLAWHEFILFTKLYSNFCRQHFGRYIHHQPGGDQATNQSQFKATLQLYSQRYGLPNPKFWSDLEADCGSCEGS